MKYNKIFFLVKNYNPQFLFACTVVFFLTILATLFRMILYPGVSWTLQIRIHITSIFVFSFIVAMFFFVNRLLDHLYPYRKGITIRILLQLGISTTLMIIIRTILLQIAMSVEVIHLDKLQIMAVYIMDHFGCFAINCGFFAEHFFTEWKKTLVQKERLQKEKALVQYNNLKNQLNPHFLFNALTSLNSLIQEDPQIASQFLKYLSKVYRYLLENKELVTMEQEINFLQNYIYILKTRFGEGLFIEVNINSAMLNKSIVPVTIQNLLENALKHNIVSIDQPLKISIYTQEEYLVVENSLQKKGRVENSNRQGLMHLKSLYQFLSTSPIIVDEKEKFFIVKVPLLK